MFRTLDTLFGRINGFADTRRQKRALERALQDCHLAKDIGLACRTSELRRVGKW